MVSEQFTTIIIKAEDGKYLTQVADVKIEERLVATMIALGKNDKAENYKEISAEEAEAIKEQQKKAIEEAQQ